MLVCSPRRRGTGEGVLIKGAQIDAHGKAEKIEGFFSVMCSTVSLF